MENTLNIPGIDTGKALEHFKGSEENFFKVLRAYMAGTRAKLDVLENYENNLKNYEITVHGIKGTSLGIFAEAIGTMAKALENAAVAKDIDFISKNNPILLEKLKELIRYLEDMFNSMDSKIVKQKKDKPDSEVLKKLLLACDIYDMMEVEVAMEKINAYQYDADDGLAEWLQHNAEEMNYEAIVERLNTLLTDT